VGFDDFGSNGHISSDSSDSTATATKSRGHDFHLTHHDAIALSNTSDMQCLQTLRGTSFLQG
jgi:hypothetical protein